MPRRIHLWALGAAAVLGPAIPSCRWGYDSRPEDQVQVNNAGGMPAHGGAGDQGTLGRTSMGGGDGGDTSTGGAGGVDVQPSGGIGGIGGAPIGSGGLGTGPFIAPLAIEEIFVGAADDDPSFTDDLRELYFGTARGTATEEIWVSVRTLPSDPWGAPTSVSAVNNGDVNAMPAISADGLTLYFVRSTEGQGATRDIYVTTRPHRSSSFGTPVLVNASVVGAGDASPCGTSDRLTLVWGLAVAGNGSDIVMSQRASINDPWPAPQSLPIINETVGDGEPWISDTKLQLFFRSSRRAGFKQDIFKATRGSPVTDLDVPVVADDLSSIGNDADPWLSQDLRTAMFASDRDGTMRIYITSRP